MISLNFPRILLKNQKRKEVMSLRTTGFMMRWCYINRSAIRNKIIGSPPAITLSARLRFQENHNPVVFFGYLIPGLCRCLF